MYVIASKTFIEQKEFQFLSNSVVSLILSKEEYTRIYFIS